ncbi:TniQ family protein [Methyloglobulus sp.]|uniref:TniQ family protein n=1 Tax=Methyloglobulus sp. TaxID=2518622 RepID=UPI0039891105
MPRRWPLHPKPYDYETSERYVRRLAETYGVSFESFCLHALGIPRADSKTRQFKEPSPEILSRLSEDTGIPIGQLEQMSQWRLFNRLLKDLEKYLAVPENYAKFESFFNRNFSQNS